MLRYLLSKCWLVAFSVETYLSRRFTDVWRRVTDVMEACVGCEGSPKWCIFYFIGCKDNCFLFLCKQIEVFVKQIGGNAEGCGCLLTENELANS